LGVTFSAGFVGEGAVEVATAGGTVSVEADVVGWLELAVCCAGAGVCCAAGVVCCDTGACDVVAGFAVADGFAISVAVDCAV
jgi:hypothetical protein